MAVVDPVTRAKKKDAALPSRGRAPVAGTPSQAAHARHLGARRRAHARSSSCCRCSLIFGAFSWYPIVRTVIMSLQHTNLVTPATWVGLDNFRKVLDDPLLPIAVKNTLKFALLALIFGYPIPLVAAVLMSEVRRFRGVYAALAYLPVVIPPVVAVLLWKTFYDGGPNGVFNTILGWVGIAPQPWLQSPDTALHVARARVDLGQRGRDDHHLPRGAHRGQPRAVRGGVGRRRRRSGTRSCTSRMPQLRGVLLLTLILQLIGTAQVFLEPYLFTSGGPVNSTLTVLLLIYDYAFGNSLGGDYGEATALSLMLAAFLALCSVIYLRATRSWSTT